MKILVLDEPAHTEGGDDRVARAVRLARDAGAEIVMLMPERSAPGPSAPPATPAAGTDEPALTPRQTHVLKKLAQGCSNKEIGRELAISEKTVKAHLCAIFRALRVLNRTQAALAAGRAGLLDP